MNLTKLLYPLAVIGFELIKSELKKSLAPARPVAPLTPEEAHLARWSTEPKKGG